MQPPLLLVHPGDYLLEAPFDDLDEELFDPRADPDELPFEDPDDEAFPLVDRPLDFEADAELPDVDLAELVFEDPELALLPVDLEDPFPLLDDLAAPPVEDLEDFAADEPDAF